MLDDYEVRVKGECFCLSSEISAEFPKRVGLTGLFYMLVVLLVTHFAIAVPSIF